MLYIPGLSLELVLAKIVYLIIVEGTYILK